MIQRSPNTVLGHLSQRALLSRLISRGRLPQTLLFSGLSGIGKRLVAQGVAKRIFCLSTEISPDLLSCGKCKECLLFEAGNSPDLSTIDCADKESASIENMRELLSKVQLRSYSGRGRVTIIDNTDQISVQAANLLLKQLEEPRPGIYFILISSNPGTLPPTLLSRCHTTYFNPLNNDQIKTVLKSKDLTLEDSLVQLSEGSVATALSISESLETWRDTASTLLKISGGDLQLALSTASIFAKDKENLPIRLSCIRNLSREMTTSPTNPEEIKAKWGETLCNALTAERLIFSRNLNPGYVLNFLLTSLASSRGFTGNRYDATLASKNFIG